MYFHRLAIITPLERYSLNEIHLKGAHYKENEAKAPENIWDGFLP